MNYFVFHLYFSDPDFLISDVLAVQLEEIGFEGFVTTEKGLDAYIQSRYIDESVIKRSLSGFFLETPIHYSCEELENKNWDEEWKKNFFEPIIIEDRCVIHSSFHKDFPQVEYELVIDPKMAFGTGHHETTSLMVSEILRGEFAGKTVLDMGCGTSVLAILAAIRGAENVTAIDIDKWCIENSIENMALNRVENIEVLLGDASLLRGRHFDIILANINQNILLCDMGVYAGCLSEGGVLYMSGFNPGDIPSIENEGHRHRLCMSYFREKNNWCMVKMVKM